MRADRTASRQEREAELGVGRDSKLSSDLSGVVAVLKAVLDTTVCDACFEDDTYRAGLECTCRCHRRENAARQAARHLLTKLKAGQH